MNGVCAAFFVSATRRWLIAAFLFTLTSSVSMQMGAGDRAIVAAAPSPQDQLAFVSSRDGSIQIYTIRADGTGRRRLTGGPGLSEIPVWSPDGQRIVFVSSRGGNPQIHVMNADGGKQMRLTGPPGESTVPVWSPDGRQIAFVTTRDRGVAELYVMHADGAEPRRLTEPESYVANEKSRGEQRQEVGGILLRPGVLHPAWSPDGKRIAFVTRVGLAEQSIQVVAPDGSGRARLATGYAPAWSPDGQQVAFVVARVGDAQIYVMKTDGTSLKRLTPPGVNLLPTWSPDGRRIAFLASRNVDLGFYVMNADGSGQQRLADVAGDLSVLPIFSWKPRLRK